MDRIGKVGREVVSLDYQTERSGEKVDYHTLGRRVQN
jgi:hypothetical protein